MRNKILWPDDTKTELYCLIARHETRHCSSAGRNHSYSEARWQQHHAGAKFYASSNWETRQDWGTD